MKRTIVAAVVAVAGGAAVIVATGGAAQASLESGSSVSAELVARADSALAGHAADARASAGDAFAVYSTRLDAGGAAHVRYTRTYHGIRVYGGDVVVHTDAKGAYAGTSNSLAAPLDLALTPAVSQRQAQQAAKAAFEGRITATGGTQLIVDAASGVGRLAWESVLSGWAPDGQTPSHLHVVTDAATNAVLGSWDDVESVVGTGRTIYSGNVAIDTTLSGSTYRMSDPSHGGNTACDMNNRTSGTCTVFTDADNVWGTNANSDRASAGADAYYGAAKTFDYYRTVHGRSGIFGNGAGVPSRVHYGNAYVNAFWDGSRMTYGDGSGNARPLVAIDVAGHEMSHGVTANVVSGGLTYSGESGGLNEATSDIFGTMVEFFAANASDPGDYLIGEKINIRGNGTPLRWMYNPSLDGASDSCWSSATRTKDVHYSSGVANHFFFDLAQGTGATAFGTSPVCGSAPAVTGIGRAKAEKIWYRALDVYFTSNTSYVNTANPANTARAYTLRAASDLYGNCSTEYRTVRAAWTAVNVAGSDAACP
jgi:Zn-dependent metalloprotease